MKILGLILALVVLNGCDHRDFCANKTVNSDVSPDGRYEATAFIRDCGATTDFSPQVYLRPKGKSLGKIGNVFIGNHSDQILLQWLSSTQLIIQSDCDVSLIVTNYEGITIQHSKGR